MVNQLLLSFFIFLSKKNSANNFLSCDKFKIIIENRWNIDFEGSVIFIFNYMKII